MPNQRGRISSSAPILLFAALLLGCGALLWPLAAAPLLARAQATRDLQRARERWESLAIDDYRIVVETTAGRLPCHRVAEVRGGQVIAVDMRSCAALLGTPPDPTVPALFDAVAAMIREADRLAGPAVRTVVEVAYDPQLSYPRVAQLRVEPIAWSPLGLLFPAPPGIELSGYSWQITEVAPLQGP